MGVEFKKPFPPITDVTPERIAAVPTLFTVGKLLSIVRYTRLWLTFPAASSTVINLSSALPAPAVITSEVLVTVP